MKQKTKTPTKKIAVKKKRKYTKRKATINEIVNWQNAEPINFETLDMPEKIIPKEKFTKDKFEKAGLLLRQIESCEGDLKVWSVSTGTRNDQILITGYNYPIPFKVELFEKLKQDHIELLKKEIAELKEKFENI